MQRHCDHKEGEHHARNNKQDDGQPFGLQPIKLGIPGPFEEQRGNENV